MKILKLLAVATFVFVFANCTTTKETPGVWVNKEKIKGKTFKKIFIVVITADIQARMKIEDALSFSAEKRGYTTVKSNTVMQFDIKNPAKPAKDDIIAHVKESGCDAVLVSSLLKEDESVHYTEGGTSYSPTTYYSYNGTYTGYYSNMAPLVYEPSYFSVDKNYFVQSNFYDAASEEIMWSVQSKVFNPVSIEAFSRGYTEALVKQLKKVKKEIITN